MESFKKEYWEESLRFPDWYIRLEKELNELFFPVVRNDENIKVFRHRIYELLGNLLEKNQIPLAPEGPDFDAGRKKIDTIIIHHTEEEPDIRLSKLSAIGLIRQYALRYLNDNQLKGKPIWSGHFLNERMVFFAYHWLVRPNGSVERLLKDNYIGWHSGNWDINMRSVAIALSGNYEKAIPPLSQIKAGAEIIKKCYPQVTNDRIFGHREVKEDRTCPGRYFLSNRKKTLLNLVNESTQ